jgi:hypothetical protein
VASISIRCPSCSATEGVVRNGKSTAGHQRYLCSHCRKTWQLQFTYTASQPGAHQKIIDMPVNGIGCASVSRALASTVRLLFINGSVHYVHPDFAFASDTFPKLVRLKVYCDIFWYYLYMPDRICQCICVNKESIIIPRAVPCLVVDCTGLR